MSETEVLKKEDEDDFEIVEEAEEEGSPEPEKEQPKEEPKPEAKAEPEKEEAKKSDDDLSGISDSVKKRIDKLTFKMREAERREQAAIEYARSLQEENKTFKQKADQFNQGFVTEYENRVKTQQQLIMDRYRAAVETGDVDSQVKAQNELAKLAVEEERVRVAKQQREIEVQRAITPAPQPVQQQQAPRPDPKAEAWAERNEWFGADDAMTATAFVLHRKLVEEEGYDPTTDEYYDALDRRIRTEFPHKFKRDEPRQAPTPVASARPSARPENNPRQVKLTRSQIEIARKLGVSVKDYARQLQKLAR